MSYKPRLGRRGISPAAMASSAVLLAVGAAFVLWHRGASFLPLLQIALLLLLPAGINLLLLAVRPRGGRARVEAPASAEPLTRKVRIKQAFCRFGRALAKRKVLWTVLAVCAMLLAANVFFWRGTRAQSVRVGAGFPAFYHIVVLAALFVLFIVFGKWCKHASPALTTESAKEARYDLALLRNLQSAYALGRIALLLTAVVLTLKLVGVFDVTRYLALALSVLFAYQTVFMLISLFVVLVRGEMNEAPEIAAPMIGVESGDLGLISYLEKNTGITMRSLWSIRLIKRSLPYAALLAVLLLWSATGISMVESHQEGAHYRMGRLQEETLAPGLHFTLPWPIDRVEVYDTKTIQTMTIGYVPEGDADNVWTEAHGAEEYRLLLGDGNEVVSINLRIHYRIGDLRAYLTGTASPELLMSSAAYEIVTLHTIERDLDTMLSTDREQFATEFREKLVAHLAPFGTGIEITGVVLESIHPPIEVAEVYQAFFSADIQAAQIILDAQSYRIQTVEFARVQAQDLIAKAKIEGFENVVDATAAVAEFMAAVKLDAAYYCNGKTADGEDCHALLLECEHGYACRNGHTAADATGLVSISSEYRYYRYMLAISEAYGSAKLIIVGEGVNAGNIYIGTVPVSN